MLQKIFSAFFISGLILFLSLSGNTKDAAPLKIDPNLELRDAVLNNNTSAVRAIFADKNKANLIKINTKVPSTRHCPGIFLITAAGMGNTEIVDILLSHGANPKIRDEATGRTALMCAVGCADPDPKLIRTLISKGADINARDNNGVTVLMSATGAFAENCIDPNVHPRLVAVRELLKYNVNINEQDKSGRTALDYAIMASKGDVISLLRARNAKATLSNKK